MKDLKKIASNKPKQVPSSKRQQEQRVHQSIKFRWETITIYKIRADTNKRPIKQGARIGDAQEINRKIDAHPKQIGVIMRNASLDDKQFAKRSGRKQNRIGDYIFTKTIKSIENQLTYKRKNSACSDNTMVHLIKNLMYDN
ncbi:hypothetical protein AVEN_145706-1 [Araneus ventricosus]|uniref:Uncharacterized protein n=1 Tax=Araneus ventricosus TaxID=182803 RepID=A0A4Y2RVK6_ARAVE|nr:hypothetical protein AVEN_145706-1 [Araneus ventricosus]